MPRPKVDPYDDFDAHPTVPAIVRLWMLRFLVPLGVIRQLTVSDQVGFDGVLVALGLWDPASAGSEKLPSAQAMARQVRALYRREEAVAKGAVPPKVLSRNLNRLDPPLSLTEVERSVLSFLALKDAHPELDEVTESLGRLSWPRLLRALAIVLGVTVHALAGALAPQAKLVRMGVLRVRRHGSEGFGAQLRLASAELAAALLTPGADVLQLLNGCVDESPPATLAIDDYFHLGLDRDLLLNYTRQALRLRRTGSNVLVHGPVGVGKTELTRALAAALGVPLYLVCTADDKGKPMSPGDRLAALGMAQALLAQTPALLLFDEAQDIFDARLQEDRPALGHKGWINQQLERNAVPTVWISNQVGELDAAFLRRFDLIVPMRPPFAGQRARVLQRAAPQLPSSLIHRLTRLGGLPPAVLARAADVAALVAVRDDAGGAAAAAVALENATLHLVGRSAQALGIELRRGWADPMPAGATNPAAGFDPELAALGNADRQRLLALIPPLRQGRPLCALFSGPAGSGKSAACAWLAGEAGLHRIVLSAASLISPWPDTAADLLTKAVQRAHAEGALVAVESADLVFAATSHAPDGLGGPAGRALLLNAIERSVAPILLTARDRSVLDEALFLHVDAEWRFGRLRPEQAVAMLRRTARALGDEAGLDEVPPGWPGAASLTPGDIAAGGRSVALMGAMGTQGTAAVAAAALEQHARRHDFGQRPLGFVSTPV